MGISIGPIETPIEREERTRRATRNRIRVLGAITIAVILARIIIKDPPPPKVAQHPRGMVQIRPGMLDTLPASERSRLDPQLVARMQMADEAARSPKSAPETAFAALPEKYHAPAAPVNLETSTEEEKQLMYSYAKKRQRMEEKMEESQAVLDQNRTMLVRFRSGGALAAEMAKRDGGRVEVRLDKTAVAELPGRMVVSITEDALTWQPPVRSGQIRVKAAKGLTITISKETARRIRIRRATYEES